MCETQSRRLSSTTETAAKVFLYTQKHLVSQNRQYLIFSAIYTKSLKFWSEFFLIHPNLSILSTSLPLLLCNNAPKLQRILEYLWWQIRNCKTTCAEMSRFVRYTYNSTLFPEIMALYGCLFISSLLSGYANQHWHMTSTVRVLMHSKLPSWWRNTSLIVVLGFPLRLSPQCGLSGVS